MSALGSTTTRVVAESADSVAFEAKHVHSIYDSIASHFSSTRYKAWPMVRQFVESLPAGALMGDIGCGNGKNLCLRHDISSIGCDYSASLLKIASGQHLEVFRADGLNTSFRSGVFDAAISIAVIHHFSTPERRRDAIRELLRIIRPDGGRALIYVWAKEQPKLKGSMDVHGDVLVPWEMHKKFDADETVHGRYYHMFGSGELETLCREVFEEVEPSAGSSTPTLSCSNDAQPNVVSSALRGSVRIEKSYFDKENWCVILQRGGEEVVGTPQTSPPACKPPNE